MISSRVRTKEQDDHEQSAKKTKRAEEEIQVKKKAYVKRIEALKMPKQIFSSLFERWSTSRHACK